MLQVSTWLLGSALYIVVYHLFHIVVCGLDLSSLSPFALRGRAYTYACAPVRLCLRVRAYICLRVCAHAHAYVLVRWRVCACAHRCARTRVYTCAYSLASFRALCCTISGPPRLSPCSWGLGLSAPLFGASLGGSLRYAAPTACAGGRGGRYRKAEGEKPGASRVPYAPQRNFAKPFAFAHSEPVGFPYGPCCPVVCAGVLLLGPELRWDMRRGWGIYEIQAN